MKLNTGILVALMLAGSFSISSCIVAVKIAGGKNKTVEKNFVIETNRDADENREIFKNVVYQMGWGKVDDTHDLTTFNMDRSTLMISRREYRLEARFTDKRIELELLQHGNFRTGTEKNADRTFQEIKERLTGQLNNQDS